VNKRQRRILMMVAILVGAMLLYAPFNYSLNEGYRHAYDWIFGNSRGRVNVTLLLLQFLAVGAIGAIAWFLCADKK